MQVLASEQESQLSMQATHDPVLSKKNPTLHPFESHLSTAAVQKAQLAAVHGLQTFAVVSLNYPASMHASQVFAAAHEQPVGHGLQTPASI